MAEKSIKKNYIYNLIYQTLLLVVPLVITPYVSRVLGADGNGVYSYVGSIVSYFVLVAILGTTTYGQREISFFQKDITNRTIAFWEIALFRGVTSILVLIFYLIFCIFQKDNKIIYLIFSVNILAVATDITWFYQGLEEFGRIVARNAVFKLLNILFIFMFVKNSGDLTIYVMGMCAIPMIGNLLLWVMLPRYVEKIKFSNIKPFHRMKDVISLFIPTVAIQVYTVMDRTMIGVITRNDFENGYYDQAEKLAKMALTIVTSLGVVLIPRIGFFFSQNRYKEIKEYMLRSYNFVWFMGMPICFGLIGIARSLIPWYLGSGYEKAIPLLQILSVLVLAIGVNNVTGMQYLIPTKRQNIFTITVSVGALVNFIGNLILINLFESIGAAISTVLAESTIAIVQLVIVRKELDIIDIFKKSIKYLIASGIMLCIVLMLSLKLEPSIGNSLALIIVGGIIYCILLVIFRDAFLLSLFQRIVNKIKK